MQFTARRQELDEVVRLTAAPSSHGLLFTGEHGIGKSRLLAEAARRVTVDSVLLRGNPAESAWPLSGFSTLFASIGDRRAVEFAGRFTLRSNDPQSMFAASRDLLTLLRGLDLPPLVLLIDDLDMMDTESRTLIGFMAGRLAGTNLQMVATATTATATATTAVPAVGGEQRLAGFTTLPLAPLTGEEAEDLVRRELGEAADDGTVQIVASRSGGIPLVIEQSIAGLHHDQVTGREPLVLPLRPPEASKAAALDRLHAVPREALPIAQELAAAPLHLLGVLTRQDLDRSDRLELLLDAGLADLHGQVVRMRDPLLRSYLYWELRPQHRRELHGELAGLYSAVDERLAAWHASFTGEGADRADALIAAATDLVHEGENEAAVELAERALVLGSDPESRHPLMLRFVEALNAAGELDLAAHYLQTVQPADPDPAFSLVLARTRIALEFERTQRVPVREVEASVSLHGDDDPEGATALLSLVTDFHSAKWDVDGARAWLRIAELFSPASAKGPDPQLAEAARMVEAVDGVPEGSSGTHRMSTDSLNALTAASLISFGTTLSYREHYAQARRVTNVVFHGRRDERLAVDWAWNLSFINEVRAGDFRRAHSVVEGWSADTAETVRQHSARALANTWHAIAQGREEAAAAHAEQCAELASAERNPAVLARLYSFQGADALLRGDHASAVRLLQLADATSAHIGNLSLVRHTANLVEAYAAAGRLREGEQVLHRMVEQQQRRPSIWLDRAVARSRAVLAPDQAAGELFVEALALYDGAQAHDGDYERARTLLAQSDRLTRLGLRTDAEHASALASAAFEAAGATLWARRAASAEPASSPEPGSILSLLKAEEREVAEMVRRGLRNREIAGELYISLRTVELRLTHIYRKVGARSRSHLASLLG